MSTRAWVTPLPFESRVSSLRLAPKHADGTRGRHCFGPTGALDDGEPHRHGDRHAGHTGAGTYDGAGTESNAV